MAETKSDEKGLRKGHLHTVEVEDVFNNMIVVVLRFDSQTYRGVLMISDSVNEPVGVEFSRSKMISMGIHRTEQPITKVEPLAALTDDLGDNMDVDVFPSQMADRQGDTNSTALMTSCNKVCSAPSVSALGLRLSYKLGENGIKQGTFPEPPLRTNVKPLREKNIRNMRLRPRQVLCSSCKSAIHDSTSNKPFNSFNKQNIVDNESKSLSQKSKPLESNSLSKRDNLIELPVRESERPSPVIRISFSGNKGEGTVVQLNRHGSQSNGNLPEYDTVFHKSHMDPEKTGEKTPDHRSSKKLKRKRKKVKHKRKKENSIRRDENDLVDVALTFTKGLKCKISRNKAHEISSGTSSGNSNHDSSSEDEYPGTVIDDSQSLHEDGDADSVCPRLMRVNSKQIEEYHMPNGHRIIAGDIVWGKLTGFPWWPARVCSLRTTFGDGSSTQMAQVTWYGCSTVSEMGCSDLSPFLKDFKLRYSKKKRGTYRIAIREAAAAARSTLKDILSPHHENPAE